MTYKRLHNLAIDGETVPVGKIGYWPHDHEFGERGAMIIIDPHGYARDKPSDARYKKLGHLEIYIEDDRLVLTLTNWWTPSWIGFIDQRFDEDLTERGL